MDKKELLECIDFFNRLTVTEEDVTTDQERANGQLVVKATYKIDGKSFTTPNLYYKDVHKQTEVYNPTHVTYFFGETVYWLDRDYHDWPKPRGYKIEDRIIEYMADGSSEFSDILLSIANDDKDGYQQRITKDGRSQMYGYNLDNNNHWHDVIRLVQAIIKSRGEEVDKRYFARLIFKWTYHKRVSLHNHFGGRSIISRLYKNIKSIQMELDIQELARLLKHKYQIILQGPPGTGKTYTAKDLAEEMIFGEGVTSNKNEQRKKLEEDEHERYKLIQFHPAYSYEDFVRGITVEANGSNVHYKSENKVLGKFAKEAAENEDKNYVLIIDEINRANLPAVLGELIYALEYRGHSVESMYKSDGSDKTLVDGDNTLVLPENLFIIGTMNTADRSVGHIDYAIRRRFAFKDILPSDKVIKEVVKEPLKQKAINLYNDVKALFDDGNIASDFKAKDVQLGHSYFLAYNEKELKLKLDYEIKPLLYEYLKDGILLEKTTIENPDRSGKYTTEAYIESLQVV